MSAQEDRLAALRALDDGWLDGVGLRPSEAALSGLEALLATDPTLAPIAGLFPTEDGGALAEFTRDGWSLSIEVLPGGEFEVYGICHGSSDEIAPVVVGRDPVAALAALPNPDGW